MCKLGTKGGSDSEVNSTEISTDSEFDDEQPHRVPPSFHLEFKPLVEVDPTIKLVQVGRSALAVPQSGDYGLSKTASTEGIASKKSLELKKKYLLGEGSPGLGILKSGSASALDSKFKSFHSNITECQKLLNPAPQGSITMPTFLKNNSIGFLSAEDIMKQQQQDSSPLDINKDTAKENIYEGKLNLSDSNGSAGCDAAKRLSLVETISATVVENKLNEIKSNGDFQSSAKDQDGSSQTRNELETSSTEHLGKTKQQIALFDLGNNGHADRPANVNNINNNNNHEITEIIDLVTPEKVKGTDVSSEMAKSTDMSPEKVKGTDVPSTVAQHGDRSRSQKGSELKYTANQKHAYLDLRTDSPSCDRSLVETTLDFSIARMKMNVEWSDRKPGNEPNVTKSIRIDNNENKIDASVANGTDKSTVVVENDSSVAQQREQPQEEEGCHETTLQVPTVPWVTKKEEEGDEEEGIESDSISESGSNSSETSSSSSSNINSSVEDIPHFILDSTTSPETQNDERFVPRLEVRDATGELMQIDSLMIIDGQYIGDPEDLKLMEELPPDTQIAAQMLQEEMNQDSINTVVVEIITRIDDQGEHFYPEIEYEENEKNEKQIDQAKSVTETYEDEEERAKTPTPPVNKDNARPDRMADDEQITPLSEFVTKRNTRLKFDTRNINKIDTLRNMPFLLDEQKFVGASSLEKPKYLNLRQHKPSDADSDKELSPMVDESAMFSKSHITSPVAMVTTIFPGQENATAADDIGDSDSQDDTEVTTQNNLTETELSDWAADDPVSENFVDIEYALNSNKGTILSKQKLTQMRLQQHQKRLTNDNLMAVRSLPVAVATAMNVASGTCSREDGIIRNLALEDIEFMDTGSEEESCIETYSTANGMMLRNCGYVEIMDPRVESKRVAYAPQSHRGFGVTPTKPHIVVEAINKQIAGRVEFIEQGSYLLGTDDVKTPINEEPTGKTTFSALAAVQNAGKLRTGDSENVGNDDDDNISIAPTKASIDNIPDDIEEDSLTIVTSSQEAGSTVASASETTLTGSVTATANNELLIIMGAMAYSDATLESTITPRGGLREGSSSERGSVVSFSSSLNDGKRGGGAPFLEDEKRSSPVRKICNETSYGKRNSFERKEVRKDSIKWVEDIGYEEYVKRLQHKIQQISNARDSLEVKKSKRKSSKGELMSGKEEGVQYHSNDDFGETVIESTATIPADFVGSKDFSWIDTDVVEKPKSVEKKIEEIAKERVKQKDIIHDLVMNKLQTKKQLNAEKRLNRSRNRNNALLVSHGSPLNGVSSSVQAKANAPPGDDQLIVSFGDSFISPEATTELVVNDKPRNNNYVGSVTMFSPSTTACQKSAVERSGVCNENVVNQCNHPQQQQQLVTPRLQSTANSNLLMGGQPLTTEQLREEARSRARLKSNVDLGLSPEDRLLLLRKKYHINLRGLTDDNNEANPNQSDDVKTKEQHRSKLISSKSVNDVSVLKQHNCYHSGLHLFPDTPVASVPDGKSNIVTDSHSHSVKKVTDCISDPNLCIHSNSTKEPGISVGGDEVPLRTRSKGKDRERRKSIIEKVSDFFNVRKKAAENGNSKDASPTKERTSNQLSTNASFDPAAAAVGSASSSGGGFLRFKISPKLKEKSKIKNAFPYGRCASEECLNSNTANGLPMMVGSCLPSSSTYHNSYTPIGRKEAEELDPPPIPPLPLNYQRSDDEAAASNEPKNEFKKLRTVSKTSRQAELKRLRIAQEIQREQEQIEVQINDLEQRGVEIEKELRGESETLKKNKKPNLGANDEKLVKDWLEIMSSITRLKVRDDELNIRQQELQLEHRHAQLKEELNLRLSFGKLDKNSSDVAAEGAILNEMLEIVAKRQALRPSLDATVVATATTPTSSLSSTIVPHSSALSSSRVTKDTSI